jgi:hypothetical protein
LRVVQASVKSAGAVAAEPTAWWSCFVLLAWLAGTGALALWFWQSHRTFVRHLGELRASGGVFFSSSLQTGPALLGLWRPKIVVPADFASRYTEREQALILAHERVHARRGDMAANLLQAALQCVFWFNPLVHAAASYFRMDQEMACDAAVLRVHPGAVRIYADALFKSQAAANVVPPTVACIWRFNHPIKERFMSLQQTQPRLARRLSGCLLVVTMALATGFAGVAARAGEAPGPTMYDVALTMNVNGTTSSPRVLARQGEPFAIEVSDGLRAQFTITPVNVQEKTFKLASTITDGSGKTLHPVLIGRLGNAMGISAGTRDAGTDTGSFDIKLRVNEAVQTALPGTQ